MNKPRNRGLNRSAHLAARGKHKDRPYYPSAPRSTDTTQQLPQFGAAAREDYSERFDYARERQAALGLGEAPPQAFPADKGLWGGRCNRGSCLKPNAVFFNRSTRAFYCFKCARLLNDVNRKEAEALYGGLLCVEYVDKDTPK